jgi:predicted permease
MTFRMALPGADYGEPNAIVDFTDELEARIQALPGVEAVGFVNRLPLLGGDNTSVSVTGDPERFADFVSVRMITPGYFDAIGVPLVAGRWLEPAEFRGPTSSVIINQTLARQLFGADDPLGRRIDLHNEVLVVVGVCGDVAGNSPDRPPPAAFYYPLAPMLVAWGAMPPTEQFFISALTRTVGDPRAAVPALREAVTSLDSDLPVYSPLTLAEIAEDRLGVRRFAMSLFGVFAALALLLGGIGIYGVMSFTVARRAPEMGMRMALGASRRSVLRTVLGHGVRLTAPGVLVGLALAMASGRVLGNLLFEVSPLDPWTYLLVASVLALVALAATLIPALRATLVDPLTSIRSE